MESGPRGENAPGLAPKATHTVRPYLSPESLPRLNLPQCPAAADVLGHQPYSLMAPEQTVYPFAFHSSAHTEPPPHCPQAAQQPPGPLSPVQTLRSDPPSSGAFS